MTHTIGRRPAWAVAWCVVFMAGCSFSSSPDRASSDLSFGHTWVRTHPFTLMALTQRPIAVADDKYSDAGLNTMLAWKRWPQLIASANRQNIPWHAHFSKRLSYEKAIKKIGDVVDNHQGGQGILVWDEPKRPQLAEAGRIVDWVKRTYPNLLVYSNAYPPVTPGKLWSGKLLGPALYEQPPEGYSYQQYLRDFSETIKPHVLMLDIYPFKKPAEGDEEQYIRQIYFRTLSDCRQLALKAGIPYWLFVQAYAHEGMTRLGGNYARRFPSDSDLRFQVFGALAYGFTGISYFTYDHVFQGALLRGDVDKDTPGEPTRLYYDVKKTNQEIRRIGQVLRFLHSTDVRYVPGRRTAHHSPNPTPIGLRPLAPGTGDIQHIAVHENGLTANALLGFFQDDLGDRYFMIVNLNHGEDLTGTQTKKTFTIKFRSPINSITRLSRHTGTPETLGILNSELKITLPGGTGDLFKIGSNMDFPGLTPGG